MLPQPNSNTQQQGDVAVAKYVLGNARVRHYLTFATRDAATRASSNLQNWGCEVELLGGLGQHVAIVLTRPPGGPELQLSSDDLEEFAALHDGRFHGWEVVADIALLTVYLN